MADRILIVGTMKARRAPARFPSGRYEVSCAPGDQSRVGRMNWNDLIPLDLMLPGKKAGILQGAAASGRPGRLSW